MKKFFIVPLALFLLGTGCRAVTQTTQIDSSPAAPATASATTTLTGDQVYSSAPEYPVPLSSGRAPETILKVAQPLTKNGYPPTGEGQAAIFGIKTGQSFNMREGCADSPAYYERYTLQSVESVNGRWKITLNTYGPLDIKLFPFETDPAGFPEGAPEWQIEFAKTKPTHQKIVLSEETEINFDEGTGAVFASNGAFIPIFVSKDEVYFKYIKLSCS